MKGRKLWAKAECQTGPLRIYAVDPKLEVQLDEEHTCDGYFDPGKSEIVLSADGADGNLKRNLLHELLHVCFEGASGDLKEKVLGGKTPEQRKDREELIISFLEQPLYDLLTRNGWLKLPKPPSFK